MISVRNSSPDDYYIMGTTVPIDFNTQNGPASVSVTPTNFQNYGGWTEFVKDPSYFMSERWSVMQFGTSAPHAELLPAGQTLDLFEIYVSWSGGDMVNPTTVVPIEFYQAPSFVPLITAVPTVKGSISDINNQTWPTIESEVIISCADKPGDANNDGDVNVGDAVYMIAYIFTSGPMPPCQAEGDPNGDCVLNVGDAVYLINYIFRGGDPPISEDMCEWP
jgi:hypothetical protein